MIAMLIFLLLAKVIFGLNDGLRVQAEGSGFGKPSLNAAQVLRMHKTLAILVIIFFSFVVLGVRSPTFLSAELPRFRLHHSLQGSLYFGVPFVFFVAYGSASLGLEVIKVLRQKDTNRGENRE